MSRHLVRMLLVLSLCLLAPSAFATMQARALEWTIGKQSFSGFLVYDDAGARRPGLVMVPDWYGVTDAAVEQAKKVAGSDYVILVADVYGKDVRPADDAAALAQVQSMYRDTGAMRARVEKAVDVLKAQAGTAPLDRDRIGAFGYCFGGSSVLELARGGAQLAGIVTFHGGLKAYGPKAKRVRTPLLVLNGANDESQKAEILPFEQEMDAAGADWTFVNFSGAVHCFALEAANKPPGCVYDPRAAARAYRIMRGFFAERFATEKQ